MMSNKFDYEAKSQQVPKESILYDSSSILSEIEARLKAVEDSDLEGANDLNFKSKEKIKKKMHFKKMISEEFPEFDLELPSVSKKL